MKNKSIIILIIVLAVLATTVLGWYFYVPRNSDNNSQNNQESYQILSIDESKFKFKNDLTEERYQEAVTALETNKQKLEKNPQNPIAWYYFGYYKNLLGDREGARLAWEKAFEYNPKRIATSNNLGDLYANYFDNYERAEFFYIKALSLKPNYSIYSKLADLYRYKMEKKGQLESLLNKAIEEMPNQKLSFLKYLYNFYEDQENQEKMTEYKEKIQKIEPDFEG